MRSLLKGATTHKNAFGSMENIGKNTIQYIRDSNYETQYSICFKNCLMANQNDTSQLIVCPNSTHIFYQMYLIEELIEADNDSMIRPLCHESCNIIIRRPLTEYQTGDAVEPLLVF